MKSFLPHHEKTCGQEVPTVTCEFCGMILKRNSLYLHTKRCSNPDVSRLTDHPGGEMGRRGEGGRGGSRIREGRGEEQSRGVG